MQEELIKQFKNGDKRAGDDFYNANINLVKYAVKSYKLESMEEEETFALVNQAFAKSMKIFDPSKGKFTTCFMANARGHILNHFRDHGNTIRSTRQDYTEKKVVFCDSLDKVIYTGDSLDICLKDKFGIEDDHSQIAVEEMLKDINGIDREIFSLYHLKDYIQSEISKALGVSPSEVSRSLARSKASLKISLREVS